MRPLSPHTVQDRRDTADVAASRMIADALGLYTPPTPPAAHNGVEAELLSEGVEPLPPLVVVFRDESTNFAHVNIERRQVCRGFHDEHTARQDALRRFPNARILRVAA